MEAQTAAHDMAQVHSPVFKLTGCQYALPRPAADTPVPVSRRDLH